MEQDGAEDESDIDLESVEVRESDGSGEADDREVIPVTTIVTATASAQALGETPSLLDSLEGTFQDLVEASPAFFDNLGETSRKMSLDEIGKLVEDTDRQSEDKQKHTSKVIAIQFVLQPGLITEMKERRDFRHAGTIRRLKLGGDADLKLGKRGVDTAPFGASQLQELAKCPIDQIMVDCAREAIAKKLSVRDIRKLVTPFVRKAKMEASGVLTDMRAECVQIIEGLEQPGKLMEQQPTMRLLQDADRLRSEFTFPELSRIHEKALAAETKIKKQKMALEEKSAGYEPLINLCV
ncbi:hypothetical protein [Desulfomonile tiedjei]|uniref:Uncharacterized protein n=1 Tax=Desulfomonile tiedjei (strain ATCC 49306 / DSM 6799 / DCB-1) TaxID=706587 RepID=I4CER6_DESTA|nr:hypothetical protein [Desulfomonile tiedjei]AFM28057.1 hypothetical protein Desti_5473 [Desulfomonile tiedjei DSM 6799]